MNQNHIKIIISLLVIIGFTLISACNERSIDSDSDLSFPEEGEVSFQKHVQPFMRVRCATAGCHDDYTQADGRRMTEYNTYFGTSNLGLIIRGNPDASLLNQVIEGKNLHLHNLGLADPTENQQDGMRRWVKNGALNN